MDFTTSTEPLTDNNAVHASASHGVYIGRLQPPPTPVFVEAGPPVEMSPYQRFIALSRYARYLPEKLRRESWEETVARYCNYMARRNPSFPTVRAYNAIVNLEVMPSMRALMTAGKALDRDNVSGYNCSFLAIDDVRAFDEALYVSMCGVGLGFSVERQSISKLPEVAEEFHNSTTVIHVEDSRIGWAKAFRELISLLYAGHIPSWDLSMLRPKGAPLKTFGGRSSGPAPLNDLFLFVTRIFKGSVGRKLNSVECHDIMTKIGDVVVSGGVRRSALISLSNLSDRRMAGAKSGQWWETSPHRALANNSVAYTEKPDIGAFMQEWLSLYESKSGERGIFNRAGVKKKIARIGRRKSNYDFGTNPCSEISLRSAQCCNLSEVVIREHDTIDTLRDKVELASILGTFQSGLTNFRYLRQVWTKNIEEERLLGVSLTGVMDNNLTSGLAGKDILAEALASLRETAIQTNIKWAGILGIPPSTAVTTGKPSGTVSQLVDAASGIHGRFSPFYVRSVRNDKSDPLSDFLIASGVPHETDVTKDSNLVFSFPMKSPKNSRMADALTAIEQLEHYMAYVTHWAEHNISNTIYVRPNEWLEVAAWVYKNFDEISGVSFLPYSDHIYQQAPFIAIDEKEYEARSAAFPVVDYGNYNTDEYEDNTHGAKTLACVSGVCEI